MESNHNTQNPLVGYFRKPEIYITLPSKGRFYEKGNLDMPPNGEIGIFPMTARDELIFKSPDALLNGATNAEVIKSCVPSIRDPWGIPSLDMDAILIGIRIATYGEMMELSVTCPKCKGKNDFQVEITQLLEETKFWEFDDTLTLDDIIIKFKPLSYKELNSESLRQFEEAKLFRIVNDDSIDDNTKMELYQESFLKLTGLSIDIMAKTIDSIEIKEENHKTQDREHIKEFIHNVDRKIFSAIQNHLDEQVKKNSFKKFTGNCTNMVDADGNHIKNDSGVKIIDENQPVIDTSNKKCDHLLETPVMFDNSRFFD